MTECKACGDKTQGDRAFPPAVVEINNPEQLVLLRKVVMPATLPEADNPPIVGKYHNVILKYEDTGNVYIYSSDGIPTAIEANIPQEVLDKIADLEEDLATETELRQTGDADLRDRIDVVADNLETEETRRISADDALRSSINTVSGNLSAEISARQSADTALNGAITAETTARQNADAGLQNQIDAISASSDVKDIVGTKAELNNYDTSTLGNNDIIKVLQDESENNATTYYRWNTTTQQFTLIGEEGPYYTKSQADVLLNTKQDTLIAGSNIQIVGDTISATDTTYTHFTGATSSTDGTQGLVPGPVAGDEDKYLKGDGTWGTVQAGPTVVQTTGTSTTDVMSQNATTSMVFADPSTKSRVQVGNNAQAQAANTVSIGTGANSSSSRSVAIGPYSGAAQSYSVALGFGSTANAQGEVGIGLSSSYAGNGYNSSDYRLLTGLYDPQSAHDAATKGYVDTAVAGAGGGITELTSADYNWPTNDPRTIALWLLDNGDYYVADSSVVVYVTSTKMATQGIYTVADFSSASKQVFALSLSDAVYGIYRMDKTTGVVGASKTFDVPTVVQTTGSSTTDVMSQNAVTSMVYADPSTRYQIRIGTTNAMGIRASAIGLGSRATGASSIALGTGAKALVQGQFDVSLGDYGNDGYNNSNYRLLTGLYDGQSAHDAATYGQVISYSAINGAGAPTTATEGKYVGQLYYDTTNEAMYFLKAIDTTTTPTTYTWEALGGGSSVNVVQTAGTSTTDVMSQDAATKMIYPNYGSQRSRVAIGRNAVASQLYSTALGNEAAASGVYAVAIGTMAQATGASSLAISSGDNGNWGSRAQKPYDVAIGAQSWTNGTTSNGYSVAIGAHSSTTETGEFSIGGNNLGTHGYNGTQYRLLTNVYDPQNAHDAATKGYVDASLPATFTTNEWNALWA